VRLGIPKDVSVEALLIIALLVISKIVMEFLLPILNNVNVLLFLNLFPILTVNGENAI